MLPEEFQTDPIEKSREVGRNHAPARMAENEVSTPEFSQNAVPAAKQRGRIGKRLREHVEDVIDSYVTRLRSDPAIPMSRTLPRPLLEDHAMSYLGDLFQTLVVLEEADDVDGRDESALLRDGSKIQQLVSELHVRRLLGHGRDARLEAYSAAIRDTAQKD